MSAIVFILLAALVVWYLMAATPGGSAGDEAYYKDRDLLDE